MKNSQNDNERMLGRKLQQFVSMIGLDSGQISMHVHQGHIHVVEIGQQIRIEIQAQANSARNGCEEEIRTYGAEDFVRDKLQPLALSTVGEYGRIVATVQSGNVKGFQLERKCRNSD